MPAKRSQWGNTILDAMGRDYDDFLDQLRREEIDIRTTVQKPGSTVNTLYFPVHGVFSIVATTTDGGAVEVATIGSEGVTDLSIFLGHTQSTLTTFCQIPGACWQVGAGAFRTALKNGPWLTRVMHRYTQCLMVQISQGVVCNARHDVLQRCARWLLMTMDRVNSSEFLLTQEFLAQMLAVRRGSVNEAAKTFQDQGLIEYSRGRIKIMKRDALEARACECYRRITDEYRRFGKEIRRS